MQQKVNVLLVEDEFITLDALRDNLEEMGYAISGDAMKAEDAIAILEEGNTDIAILDIQLKGEKTGIWVARQIQEKYKIPFIFLSAFSDKQTVAAAVQTQPASYLVKPFTHADLFTAIEVALYTYANPARKADALAGPKEGSVRIKDTIFVKDNNVHRKVQIAEIQYIEAFKNYLEICMNGQRHTIRSTLKDFLSVLPKDTFLQTHRSFVVNVNEIEEVGSSFIAVGGFQVPLSRTYRDEVLKRLNFL